MNPRASLLLAFVLVFPGHAHAAAFHNPYGRLPTNALPGDSLLKDYFRTETQRVVQESQVPFGAAGAWYAEQPKYRRQLAEMLGLDPLPARGDLSATVTGKLEESEFTVEKLHFQSLPGLYVTANLYLPRGLTNPAPAILYVCGHALVKTNEVSYGCKVAYQHHGVWFAQNGYVCLIIDTIELGEIQGRHHGTYRDGRWWWNSRGYTPAGAETWNAMRALDYLQSRPEVDRTRLGVTGRSGGGATSWWLAALDDRVRVACPVAGITDLRNHVVDGTVEGHCDCMFMVNTYRWDFPQVAALVAPRPLLIGNTDKDTIFPLDGVLRLHERVREVYDHLGASDQLGLLITEGEHHDTQDLQVPVLRWFNRSLKNDQPLVANAAAPRFSGQQLKVFTELPADERVTRCDEFFTRVATETEPLDPENTLERLKRKTFAGWPERIPRTDREGLTTTEDGIRWSVWDLNPGSEMALRCYVAMPAHGRPRAVRVQVVDDASWQHWRAGAGRWRGGRLAATLLIPQRSDATPHAAGEGGFFDEWLKPVRDQHEAAVLLAPRGIGDFALNRTEPYYTQVRRRFQLVGQTLAGMQVWDVCHGLEVVRAIKGLDRVPLHLKADLPMTEVATFAALFGPRLDSLTLLHAPRSDQEAPDFLNWSRLVTPGQLLRLAETRCPVQVNTP